MIIKLIGSLIIIVASTFIGYSLSRTFVRRPSELRTMQLMLQMLETEISFMSNILSDAMEKISKTDSAVSLIFKNTAEIINNQSGINASIAWESALKGAKGRISLNNEDLEILIAFGKMLGSTDVEGQVKNIRMTINHLKVQETKAEESRGKNEKMYKSLGILGGLAVVIILI